MKQMIKTIGIALLGVAINATLIAAFVGGIAYMIGKQADEILKQEDAQVVIKAGNRFYKDTMQNLKDYSEGK